MAKISPISIKYVIHAKFIAEGMVEKPDVIGALFGQTEGLLGAELEMRELQKEGKIGRIDVNAESNNGKTTGEILIPSSLDKTETTIIAAAIETIDRIGPSDAKIEIIRIEDVRGNKREYIIERAKKLLEGIHGAAESREIEDAVKISAKISKLKEYGDEKLPAGDISAEEIIVVEGRADVISLLKAGVNNVIGMNGTILPKTIKELSLEKTITLFVDGDRGGKLIAKNAVENARIDYIIMAPDGKEVEELSSKEILSCLRKKVPVSEFRFENGNGRFERRKMHEERREKQSYEAREKEETEKQVEKKQARELSTEDKELLRATLDEISGEKMAIFFDENMQILRRVPVSEISLSLSKIRKQVYAIVLDGIASSYIIKTAERFGCSHIVARNFANIENSRVNLVSL